MQQFSLNDLFRRYKRGKIKRDEFEGAIYSYLFYNQKKTCISHWNQNEYEDYISWFYQRLKKAIDSYNEVGSSFEAFINKFILISSREYRVRLTTQSVIEYSAWSARIPELYVREEAPSYYYEKSKNIISRLITDQNGNKSSRRILALVLKCYYYISDDFIEKISPKIGIDCKELKEMMERMRKTRQKKDDAIYQMKERIYSQFYRCIVFEKRLSYLQENTSAYNKLKLRLEKAKKRLEKMRERITLVRTEATNKEVAEVIGVKKGTVDSSLHKLKEKIDFLADKTMLN